MLKFILLTSIIILILSIVFKKEKKYKKKVSNIYGCTFKNALNYNKNATKDNLSCNFIKKVNNKKFRVYNIREHQFRNSNNKNTKKIITYQLNDKNNNIKNSNNEILYSIENLLFDVYYDESNNPFKLVLLNSFIVPIDLPDNMFLNEIELSLFKDNNKLSFDNNKLILIINGIEILNVNVNYKVVDTRDYSNEVEPYNKEIDINEDQILSEGVVPFNSDIRSNSLI